MMEQDYDPCEHGMDSHCCTCEIAQLRRQAEDDEEEIVQLQELLAAVYVVARVPVPEAAAYLAARGLLPTATQGD